jgi:transposase-like protein
MAVERLKACDSIVELSQELGVHRRLLYKWRDQFAWSRWRSSSTRIATAPEAVSKWRIFLMLNFLTLIW